MKDSFIDSILCTLAKGLSFILCHLPLPFCLWIGRRVGDLAFFFYRKRREVAYANLKSCLGQTHTPTELLRLERKIFQNLMQTGVEVLRFPKVNKAYVDRYVTMKGFEHIEAAKQKGKGLIVLAAHYGNWELQGLALALRGYPMQVLVRQQKFPKTNALLNRYRELTGCRVIHRGYMTREILRHLNANGIVGILTDQDAGKKGVFVPFFGRPTSFAPGPIAFALRTGCDVIPCFIRRVRNAFHVVEVTEPLRLTQSGDEKEDIRQGLKQFAERLEQVIRNAPDQWLWLHKRWKSTPSRRIAILSDGKAGHLSQSRGVSFLLEHLLAENGKEVASVEEVEVRFRQRWRRTALAAFSLLANRRNQGHLGCVRFALEEACYEKLVRPRFDFIISAGSSLAPLNRILSLEHVARSIVVMDPVIPPARRFDLAIIPAHDRPPLLPNIVATVGAPHLLTEESVARQAERLLERIGPLKKETLGILIGGRTEIFRWEPGEFSELLETLSREAAAKHVELLVSSSRRTPEAIETLLEERLGNDPRCRLLVLANRKNLDGVVPGILGLSKVVIVTGESMSMVSEAASVAERVIVLLPAIRKRRSKIEKALSRLAKEGTILLTEQGGLPETLQKAFGTERARQKLEDERRIQEGLRRLL